MRQITRRGPDLSDVLPSGGLHEDAPTQRSIRRKAAAGTTPHMKRRLLAQNARESVQEGDTAASQQYEACAHSPSQYSRTSSQFMWETKPLRRTPVRTAVAHHRAHRSEHAYSVRASPAQCRATPPVAPPARNAGSAQMQPAIHPAVAPQRSSRTGAQWCPLATATVRATSDAIHLQRLRGTSDGAVVLPASVRKLVVHPQPVLSDEGTPQESVWLAVYYVDAHAGGWEWRWVKVAPAHEHPRHCVHVLSMAACGAAPA